MAGLDLSFLDFEETDAGSLAGFFGRQMSEPPLMGSMNKNATASMTRKWSLNADEPLKVTQRKLSALKKTTFDLSGDDKEDYNLAIHRQMSEPVKVYMSCGTEAASKSNKIKKSGEELSSGSDGESQATTGGSPSVFSRTVSSCSMPGAALSRCTTASHPTPGSPAGWPARMDLPPGLELPPGLQNFGCEVFERPGEDSELPQKVPTSFCKSSLSASAPEFTPGNEDQFGADARTANTVTVTGLAKTYTRESLVAELADSGFSDGRDYDYLCVPMQASVLNKGVCFINFKTPSHRHAFVAAYQGREMRQSMGRTVSVKPCAPSDAKAQIAPATEVRRAQFCPWCGGGITTSFRFCTQCGSSLQHLP
mmetsp:Transcript_13390/g.35381  ORF Transcript_13390/g.35381 Transcript_13390/m.35381 type:complete len:366 (+) Transcript_13390:89-1186(+)